MIMFEPILPAIIIFGLFVFTCIRKKNRNKSVFIYLCFYVGVFLCFIFYFIPLPLDKKGFCVLGDSLLEINEAVIFEPFKVLSESGSHLRHYFLPLLKLFAGAGLIGFSINNIGEKRNFRIKTIIVLVFPLLMFIFYSLIRLFTGIMLKRADITDIFWFVLFYLIGYVIYLIKRRIDINEKNDAVNN